MRLVKSILKLNLKSIKSAKRFNFTGEKYRPVDANISSEIKELIKLGLQMSREFNIKPRHLTETLNELRKL